MAGLHMVMRTKRIVDGVAYMYWEIAADTEAIIENAAAGLTGPNEDNADLEKEDPMNFESDSMGAEEVQEGELGKVHWLDLVDTAIELSLVVAAEGEDIDLELEEAAGLDLELS